MASWFGASTSGRNGSAQSRAQHNSSSSGRGAGVPDFLSQADDPDKRRIDSARAQSRGGHDAAQGLAAAMLRCDQGSADLAARKDVPTVLRQKRLSALAQNLQNLC